jgi:hypothetical protein
VGPPSSVAAVIYHFEKAWSFLKLLNERRQN